MVLACAPYLTFELPPVWQQIPLLVPFALQDNPVDVAGDRVVELLRSRGTPHHRIVIAYEAPQIVLRSGMPAPSAISLVYPMTGNLRS